MTSRLENTSEIQIWVTDVPALLAGGYKVPQGQDMIVSVYNIHRNPDVWDDPDDFIPERFPLDGPVPNEQNTDFRYTTSATSKTLQLVALCS